jgi:F-type H+-transporting ATPase subunit gamma
VAGGVERQLRRRIRSIQATKKITRAFELIAASQIVRAQNQIAANRPFKEGMDRIVREAAAAATTSGGVVGTKDEPASVALVLIVGDRGLSGPYNSSVLRAGEAAVVAHLRRGADVALVTVGRKAVSYFRFRGRETADAFSAMADRPTYADARRVAASLWRRFATGEVEAVQLVSTRYHSAGRQSVEVRQLLPLPEPAGTEGEEPPPEEQRGGYTEFEPDPETLLRVLMPRLLEAELFTAMLEAAASEHASRQRAMAAATENAEELVRTLTRVMNRARQDAITNEIMEIVGGAEALRAAKGA